MPLAQTAAIKRRALSGPALRGFFRVSELWGLSQDEQLRVLGNPSRSTFSHWRRNHDGQLPPEVLERISYILGIYKALQLVLPDAQSADTWIKKPNSAQPFNGQSALQYMLSGKIADLACVRRYLDAQRGWI